MTMPVDIIETRWTAAGMPIPFVDTMNNAPDLTDVPDLWGSARWNSETARDVTMGSNPWKEEAGVIYVGLFARAGHADGKNALDAAVTALRTAFHGYVFEDGANTFQALAVEGPHEVDETNGEWWQLAMSIPYTYQSRRAEPPV